MYEDRLREDDTIAIIPNYTRQDIVIQGVIKVKENKFKSILLFRIQKMDQKVQNGTKYKNGTKKMEQNESENKNGTI